MFIIFLLILLQEAHFVKSVDDPRDELQKVVKELETLKKKITELERKMETCPCQIKENTKRLLLGNGDGLGNKIAFDAFLTHNLDHSGITDTTIVFDSVLTNTGNAYQKDLGAFVAPVKGVYLFSYTIHAEFTANILASLTINGNKITSIQADGSGSAILIPSSSRTVILELNQDDHAYIQILKESRGNLKSNSYAYSSFSGVLLFDN